MSADFLNVGMNMPIFDSIYKQDGRLYIDWDILYKCNIKCPYCYLDDRLNTIVNNSNINLFLRLLTKIKHKYTLGLLGGEPTESIYYFDILESLGNHFKKNVESEAYVSTNLTKDVDWYHSHKKYSNIHHWASLHPHYHVKKVHLIEDKLMALAKNTDKQIIISPMLFTDKFSEFYKEIYEIYKRVDGATEIDVIYSPQYIEEDKGKGAFDSRNFAPTDPVYNQSIKEFIVDGVEKTTNEIIYGRGYKTKGMSCYYNYYNISPDFKYSSECTYKSGNALTNPIKFLKDMSPDIIKCKFDECLDFPKMLSIKSEQEIVFGGVNVK